MPVPFVRMVRQQRGFAAGEVLRTRLELLEGRIVPVTDTSGSLLNLGDTVSVNQQSVPLLTRTDEIAIRIELGHTDVLSSLIAPNGPLVGMQLSRMLSPDFAIFTDASNPADVHLWSQRLNAANNFVGVSIALPTYVNAATNRWTIPTGEVIVALRPGVDPNQTFDANPDVHSWRSLAGTTDQYLLTLSGRSPVQVGEHLRTDDRVSWASPDFYQDFRPFGAPNDPLLNLQWHHRNTGQSGGVSGADVDSLGAWDITFGGSSSVTVAVIDDGVQIDHPDLINNIWTNPGEIAGNSIDDDGNGWIDDVHGWDFTTNTPYSSINPDTHGTAVAGVIAATGDNGIGGAGVAFRSNILPVRIGQGGIYLSDSTIAEAIYYAAGRKRDGSGSWNAAQILNLSWGGGSESSVVRDALAWASSSGRGGQGAITFVATGNSFSSSLSFPAILSTTLSGVVAVGASTDSDNRAGYSNYGTGLEFLAPSSGGSFGIVTTDLKSNSGLNTSNGSAGDYTDTSASAFGGTSAASPIAAGIAALILARDSNLSAAAIRGLMRNTTDYIGPTSITYDPVTGFNSQYGFGRVDAATAVRGVGVREIQVIDGKDGRTNIPDGTGIVNLGTAPIGSGVNRIIRIRNQGTLPLTLGTISITGPFVLATGLSSTTLGVGESATFIARFQPIANGSAIGSVSFATNDPDESTFDFTLTGTGIGASISGVAFEDTDGDGVRGILEPGLGGREVFLDLNGNHILESGEITAITDFQGFYSFQGLAPGTYTVSQVLPSGWAFTNPAIGSHVVTLTAGGSSTTSDFGQVFGATIYGTVINDQNADGMIQGSEPGLSGWRVFLDHNNDGSFTSGEYYALTDGFGNYRLQGPAGSYQLRIEPVTGWRHTSPISGAYSVNLTLGSALTGKNFTETNAADLMDVDPDPRSSPVDSISIQFGESVTGLDRSDFSLLHDGKAVSLAHASLSGSGTNYLLSGLSSLTNLPGGYLLSLNAAGSGIRNAAGFELSMSAWESWIANFSIPIAVFSPVFPDPRDTPVDSVSLTFTDSVTGVDLSDFVLKRDSQIISLSGAFLSGSGKQYSISNLNSLTPAPGIYVLTLNAAGSGIVGSNGVPLSDNAVVAWTTHATTIQATLQEVIPNTRSAPVDSVTVIFSAPVTGVGIEHFHLTHNAGTISLAHAKVTGFGTTYTLSGLTGLSSNPGGYTVALQATNKPILSSFNLPVFALAQVSWIFTLPIIMDSTSTETPSDTVDGIPTVDESVTSLIHFPAVVVGADAGGSPHVRVIDPISGKAMYEFMAYDPRFTGGVRVAMADVTGDGIPDIVTSPGEGGGPHIRVFDGRTGQPIQEFFAYNSSLRNGAYLALADINGDGVAEIVTGAGPGGGPHVRVFDARTGQVIQEFMAYDPNLRTGVTVAAGDIDNDGAADIATGAGAHVRVFSGRTGEVIRNFYAYDPNFWGGVSVAIADVTGDGQAELITGAGLGGGPHVRIFDGESLNVINEFFAYEPSFTGGIRVSAGDMDGDGVADIITSTMPGGGPLVRAFHGLSSDLALDQLLVYAADFRGGVFIGGSG